MNNSKKSEKISDAIGELDEKIISEADKKRTVRKTAFHKKPWLKIVSAAACLALVAGLAVIIPRGDPGVVELESGISSLGNASDTVNSSASDTAVSDNSSSHDTISSSGDLGSNPPTSSSPQPPPSTAGGGDEPALMKTLAKAVYPPQEIYPWIEGGSPDRQSIWHEQNDTRKEFGKKLNYTVNNFYKKTVKKFLTSDEEENLVYSPVSVYMALSMLAEITDGNSRTQILGLLGCDNIETLREQAKNMWNANYRDDGLATSILANSLWLDQDLDFKQEAVDTLAEDYLASVFHGDFSSEEAAVALQNWLNEQTGGLLKDAVEELKFSPQTILVLCSTLFFEASWSEFVRFDPDKNDQKIFHAPNGDRETEFMNNSMGEGTYYYGNDYGAVKLDFSNGGAMWLILPDESKTVDDVIKSGEYLDMVLSRSWNKEKYVILNYSVPKFDVSSNKDLKDELKELGVTGVFDINSADLSPLTNIKAYISEVQHAARVVIDEDGCTAAAFTVMPGLTGGTDIPPEEIDFVVDRPFIFAITSDTDQPLFIGTVYEP